MRVLIAPGDFGASLGEPPALSASQAAKVIERGWAQWASSDQIERCALSDGGPGMLEALRDSLGQNGVQQLPVATTDSVGADRSADLLLSGSTGYVEAAQVCGLARVSADRHPVRATSAGLAPLLIRARERGVTRVVLGLGGLGSHDAGAGLLAALALAEGLVSAGERNAVRDRFLCGGGALGGVQPLELSWLEPLRRAWREIELIALADTATPLLGLHGASAVDAPNRGADRVSAQRLERCLGDYSAAAATVLGLPSRGRQAPTALDGGGAGGGLAYGLGLIGGLIRPAASTLQADLGLAAKIATADVVVTGSHTFGWRSLRDSVITSVTDLARDRGLPVVVVAATVQVGRREAQTVGVDAAYGFSRDDTVISAETLEALAMRVARTWSRP